MKTLITICLLMAAMFSANAQTKDETLRWLQENYSNGNIRYPESNVVEASRENQLEMTTESIKVFNSGASAQEKWKDVTEVSYDNIGYQAGLTYIKFKNQYKGEAVFINIANMYLDTKILVEKLKLMATLNGAVLK
ncbi:hypothetical protein [Chryseobacterium sp.]|uniref:hypothetical protein n=1 Tax=Chryseobacterium sp. TaxID=1871047 RepID=UPI0011CA6400|nr:hypothetical protein [Chryseobacterium sp.]TXF77750.1 hypothetical protein FUA25_07450 [Chryseobacterium sp.]